MIHPIEFVKVLSNNINVFDNLRLLSPGQKYVYWIGFLAHDCDHHHDQRLRSEGRVAREAAQQSEAKGHVVLVQQRVREGVWRYIAVGTRRGYHAQENVAAQTGEADRSKGYERPRFNFRANFKASKVRQDNALLRSNYGH
jgi:hypothetical protein